MEIQFALQISGDILVHTRIFGPLGRSLDPNKQF